MSPAPPLPQLATIRAVACPPCRTSRLRTRAPLARPQDPTRGSGRAEAQNGAGRAEGVSAAELLQRVELPGRADGATQLRPDQLEGWLLAAGFAVADGVPGLLKPTPAGLEVARALTLVEFD